MSIMIKGAEMPKGCAECPCILEEWMCGAKGLYVHNELINPFKERPNWCPLAEVVRCKDCKWGNNKTRSGKRYCELSDMYQVDDGFCNWGEKIK